MGIRWRQGGTGRDKGAGTDPRMPGGTGYHPGRRQRIYGCGARVPGYHGAFDAVQRDHCLGNSKTAGAQRSEVDHGVRDPAV